MRAFIAVFACIASSVAAEPVISVNQVSSLVFTSASLTLNMVKFTSDKFEEALSGESKELYHKFTVHCHQYTQMVKEWWSVSPVKNWVGIALTHVSAQYDRISALSAKILDPVVHQLETSYPATKGLVGASILDRMLLVGWLVWMWRALACVAAWAFGCRCCKPVTRK
jgi:hypothetical protein